MNEDSRTSQHYSQPIQHHLLAGPKMSFPEAMEHLATLHPPRPEAPAPKPPPTIEALVERFTALKALHADVKAARRNAQDTVAAAKSDLKTATRAVEAAKNAAADAAFGPDEAEALHYLKQTRAKVQELNDKINAQQSALDRMCNEGEDYSRLQDITSLFRQIARAMVNAEIANLPPESLRIIQRCMVYTDDAGIGNAEQWLLQAIPAPINRSEVQTLRSEMLDIYGVVL